MSSKVTILDFVIVRDRHSLVAVVEVVVVQEAVVAVAVPCVVGAVPQTAPDVAVMCACPCCWCK